MCESAFKYVTNSHTYPLWNFRAYQKSVPGPELGQDQVQEPVQDLGQVQDMVQGRVQDQAQDQGLVQNPVQVQEPNILW